MSRTTRPALRSALGLSAVAIVSILVLVGCQAAGGEEEPSDYPSRPLTITVPAAPGGGYDQLGRAVQQTLSTTGLVDGNIQVFNNPGAGGMVGFNQFVQDEAGDPYQLLSMGVVLLGAEKTSDLDVTVEDDTTPIAQLASSYLAITVRADSPIETITDLGEALAADPGGVSIAGSVTGSLEQILTGLFAESFGADPAEVNYVPYENASEQVTALLSGDADVSVTGISETQTQLDDGSIRALVVSSPERVDGVDAPTFAEAGLGDELVMANWRGVVAPSGLSDAQRDAVVELITRMRDTEEWKQQLESHLWSDTFLAGEEFAEFVASESERIGRALEGLGVTEG